MDAYGGQSSTKQERRDTLPLRILLGQVEPLDRLEACLGVVAADDVEPLADGGRAGIAALLGQRRQRRPRVCARTVLFDDVERLLLKAESAEHHQVLVLAGAYLEAVAAHLGPAIGPQVELLRLVEHVATLERALDHHLLVANVLQTKNVIIE